MSTSDTAQLATQVRDTIVALQMRLVGSVPVGWEVLGQISVELSEAAQLAARVGVATATFDGIGVLLAQAADAEGAERSSLQREIVAVFDLLLAELVDAIGQPAKPAPASPKKAGDSEHTDFPLEMSTDEEPELIEEFIIEANELLGAAEDGLLNLDPDHSDPEILNAVFRAMHSIKGTAGFLGLVPLQRLAHVAEAVLAEARENRVRVGDHADVLLETIDCMSSMVGLIKGAGSSKVALPENARDLYGALIVAADPNAQPVASGASTGTTKSVTKSAAAPAAKASTGSDDGTVRIPSWRVDSLLDAVGELLIAYSMVAEDATAGEIGRADFARSLGKMGTRIRHLQQISVSMRLVSLQKTFSRIQRLVRHLSSQLGKPVELTLGGAETEIDRSLVESIYEPLVHLVRNGLDHGIETAEQRKQAGKPVQGNLTLRASHISGNVVISIEDDGKGLDPAALKAKAVRKGLVAEDAVLTKEQAYELIFSPGFSTAAAVTDVSGRGVGMDVVKRRLESIHGRVDVDSQLGRGTKFSLSVPLTTAITDAMQVWVGAERFLIPTRVIRHSFQPEPNAVSSVSGGGKMVRLRDDYLPVLQIHEFFGIPAACSEPSNALFLDVDTDSGRWALMVDRIDGKRQVVVKNTGLAPDTVPALAGGAVMGDGKVALVFDVPSLVRMVRAEQHAGHTKASALQ